MIHEEHDRGHWAPDKKRDYLIKTLSRTKRKDYENYIINAIYHKLNRLEIQPVTQQYIRRSDGKHALVDLYFPALNYGVECDEAYHINNQELDIIRVLTMEDMLNAVAETSNFILRRVRAYVLVVGRSHTSTLTVGAEGTILDSIKASSSFTVSRTFTCSVATKFVADSSRFSKLAHYRDYKQYKALIKYYAWHYEYPKDIWDGTCNRTSIRSLQLCSLSVATLMRAVEITALGLRRSVMTKNMRTFGVIGLIVLIVSGIFLAQNLTSNKQEGSTIFFLPAQGQIHTSTEAEVPIDLLCFAATSKMDFANGGQELKVFIDNPNLEITEYTIEAGSQYKGMRLYAISLIVKANQLGKQIITQVTFEDKAGKTQKYSVGEIVVSVEEPSTEDILDISGHTAGAGLGETYEFSISNKTNQTCNVTGIDFGSLTPYLKTMSVYIDNNRVENEAAIILKTGDELTVKAEFKTDAGKDVYYVSPKMMYKIEGTNAVSFYTLPHALLGLPVSEDKVQEIYNNYFI